MKILITIYKLNISGSATYTLTLANELKKNGHKLIVFCPIISELLPEFKKFGIKVVDNIKNIKYEKFDIIIAQHSVIAILVRKYFFNIPMVFISHGVLPLLEQPPSVELNISHYIAVSEEVRSNLIDNYNISEHNISIVRNGVDTKIFFESQAIKKKLKSVLFLTHHRNLKVITNVTRACRRKKLKLMIVGVRDRQLDVKKYINKVDLVISLGRGVLESMSCGRAVIVYDYNGGDGMVLSNNINNIKQKNFSGRKFSYNYNVRDLIKEFNKYNQSLGIINRKLIKNEFDISITVNKLEKVIKMSIHNFNFKKLSIPNSQIDLICEKLKLANKTHGPRVKIVKELKKLLIISVLKILRQ